jgi:hypothetical protein
MNTSIHRHLAFARVSLTLAALAAAGCTTHDQDTLNGAGLSPTGERHCLGRASAALLLESPDGQPFKLAYHPGCGWSRMSSLAAAAYAGTTAANKGDDPVTLFIDGPTGYAFAWTSDAGWKFIGHVTESR